MRLRTLVNGILFVDIMSDSGMSLTLSLSEAASTPGLQSSSQGKPPELQSPLNSELGASWDVPGIGSSTDKEAEGILRAPAAQMMIIHTPREGDKAPPRKLPHESVISSYREGKRSGSRKSSRSGSGSESDRLKGKYRQALLEKTELKKKLDLAEIQLKHIAGVSRDTGAAWEHEHAMRLDSESRQAADRIAAEESIQQTASALRVSEREKNMLWEKSAAQSEQAANALYEAFAEIQKLRGESAETLNANLHMFEEQKKAATDLEGNITARDEHIARLIKQIRSLTETQREHAARADEAQTKFSELKKLFYERTADMDKTIADGNKGLADSRAELQKRKLELDQAKEKIMELEAKNASMITTSQFEMYVAQLTESQEKLKVAYDRNLVKMADKSTENTNLKMSLRAMRDELDEMKATVNDGRRPMENPPRAPVASARPGAAPESEEGSGSPPNKADATEVPQSRAQRLMEMTENFCQSLINKAHTSVKSDAGSSDADDFASAEGEKSHVQRESNTQGEQGNQRDYSAQPAAPAVVRHTESVASEMTSHATLLERGPRGTKATELKVPKFPKFQDLPIWLNKLARNVWAISDTPGDMAEVGWLMEATVKSYEELGDSGEERFTTMDALLVMALEKIIPPELNRIYIDRCHDAIKEKRLVLGRQLVWLIINSFKTADHMSIVYSYDTLMSMEWYGDAHVADFKSQWHRMVDNLAIEPKLTPNALRDILFKKMSEGNTKVFADDLKHYNREKGKSQVEGASQREDYSYDFLLSIMDREIRQRAEDKQVEARKRSTRRPGRDKQDPAAPAPAAKPKAKPKPKEKDDKKDKDKDKDKSTRSRGLSRDKKEKKDRGRSGSSTRDKPMSEVLCYNYHHHLHDSQKPKCAYENCRFKHGAKISKDELAKLKKPKSRSRSPSAKKGLTGKDWYTDSQGNKKPKHCGAFLAGACNYEKENGKPCKFPHLTQAQYDKKLKELA